MSGGATNKRAARRAGLAVYILELPECQALALALSLQPRRSRLTYGRPRFRYCDTPRVNWKFSKTCVGALTISANMKLK